MAKGMQFKIIPFVVYTGDLSMDRRGRLCLPLKITGLLRLEFDLTRKYMKELTWVVFVKKTMVSFALVSPDYDFVW
jgi:hypothetical protein